MASSEIVQVQWKLEGTIAFADGRVYQDGDISPLNKRDALRYAKIGKCEILKPQRKTAAKRAAPVTRAN